MNKDRLLRLASFLDKLPPEKFCFEEIAHEDGKPMLEALAAGHTNCGTVGCAIGWAPAVFPGELEWKARPEFAPQCKVRPGFAPSLLVVPIGEDISLCKTSWDHALDTAKAFFDLSTHDACFLFLPDGVEGSLDGDASAIEVAEQIRWYVRTDGTCVSHDGEDE